MDRTRQNISIVIIDSDTGSTKRMLSVMKELGSHVVVEGTATTFEHGYEMIHKYRPLIAIIEVDNNSESSLARLETILQRFPGINIFATSEDKSSDAILKVIRAGASEYLLRPVSEENLLSAIQKVGRLWVAKPAADSEMARIYTFFGPSGGVGTTTLATNLAVSIYEATKKPTLLVDLDLDAGDVTTFLNMKSSYTISDATVNIARLDETFLNGVISKHESGIYVLAEPQKVKEGVSIPADDVSRLFALIRSMFSYIIVDTETTLDERMEAAIDMSDCIFLVFILTLPGIKHAQRYLRYFDDKDIAKDKIKLVVNRYLKRGDIQLEDTEKILNHPVFWSVINDYDTAISSMNKGIPVSEYKKRSSLNASIEGMTKAILESEL